MSNFLDNIRCAKKIPLKDQILHTIAIMLLGIVLGTISKYLDCTPSNTLPAILGFLDVRNFLGRLAIWVFLAVCISIYSASPSRAGINVLVFFAGMVTSYYLYSKLIAGFFPKSYAMIWVGFTLLSPFLAFICWYAKGSGRISLILSAGITAALINMTFLYGWMYFHVRSLLELVVFLCGVAVIRRTTARENVMMAAVGIILAFILNWIMPFQFG